MQDIKKIPPPKKKVGRSANQNEQPQKLFLQLKSSVNDAFQSFREAKVKNLKDSKISKEWRTIGSFVIKNKKPSPGSKAQSICSPFVSICSWLIFQTTEKKTNITVYI